MKGSTEAEFQIGGHMVDVAHYFNSVLIHSTIKTIDNSNWTTKTEYIKYIQYIQKQANIYATVKLQNLFKSNKKYIKYDLQGQFLGTHNFILSFKILLEWMQMLF